MKKTRRDVIKNRLTKTLREFPEANLVKNRYRTMHWVLKDFYPIISGSVSSDTFKEFLREIVYLDRQIRLNTEGRQKEEKEVLAQQFVVDEIL